MRKKNFYFKKYKIINFSFINYIFFFFNFIIFIYFFIHNPQKIKIIHNKSNFINKTSIFQNFLDEINKEFNENHKVNINSIEYIINKEKESTMNSEAFNSIF
jgi:hypothetical protein